MTFIECLSGVPTRGRNNKSPSGSRSQTRANRRNRPKGQSIRQGRGRRSRRKLRGGPARRFSDPHAEVRPSCSASLQSGGAASTGRWFRKRKLAYLFRRARLLFRCRRFFLRLIAGFQPLGVKDARLVDAFVGVRAEKVALGLEQIGRQTRLPVTIEVG